ncbi:hypothetical protein BDQ17DRAFT_1333507 [Cyathus striatus]|nr:hypothetical protein BDQ17DRAFT_1333507 [Cyathus striatus]
MACGEGRGPRAVIKAADCISYNMRGTGNVQRIGVWGYRTVRKDNKQTERHERRTSYTGQTPTYDCRIAAELWTLKHKVATSRTLSRPWLGVRILEYGASTEWTTLTSSSSHLPFCNHARGATPNPRQRFQLPAVIDYEVKGVDEEVIGRPPTFSSPEIFHAITERTDIALQNAIEGAEEAPFEFPASFSSLTTTDTLIGIATSGRTPYVLSDLSYARARDVLTLGLVFISPSETRERGECDVIVVCCWGEVVMGVYHELASIIGL